MNSMTLNQHQCYDRLAFKPASDRRLAVLMLLKLIDHVNIAASGGGGDLVGG